MTSRQLPASFLRKIAALEAAYLETDDPIRQSGFGGGAERWRAEREAVLDAIEGDGDLLDIGCANGYLLECLVTWGLERGLRLTPYGLDIGAGLIELARRRLPEYADNFYVGNAWDWTPPRRFRYVYSIYDNVPETHLSEYISRLLKNVVAPVGRLILGAYGSRSRGTPPFDIASFLESTGWQAAGTSSGGDPPIAAFAWIDNNDLGLN